MFKPAALLFAVVAILGSSNQAEAQYWGTGYFGGPWNYPFFITERAPYYALNPSVYYSTPVARSYGLSPYAYPGLTLPRERSSWAGRRATVAQSTPADVAAAPPPQPLYIKNPFVTDE